eukprot:3785715-Prymnesium_polylepis.1
MPRRRRAQAPSPATARLDRASRVESLAAGRTCSVVSCSAQAQTVRRTSPPLVACARGLGHEAYSRGARADTLG